MGGSVSRTNIDHRDATVFVLAWRSSIVSYLEGETFKIIKEQSQTRQMSHALENPQLVTGDLRSILITEKTVSENRFLVTRLCLQLGTMFVMNRNRSCCHRES